MQSILSIKIVKKLIKQDDSRMYYEYNKFKNSIKQYESISFACQYFEDFNRETDNDLVPLSLDGIEIKSKINTKYGKYVDDMQVDIVDIEQGIFTLTPTVEKLPLGTLQIDICLIKNGSIAISDTFSLNVEKSETM